MNLILPEDMIIRLIIYGQKFNFRPMMKHFLLIIFLFICYGSTAQQIMMDKGMRAANLWCFPLLNDSLTYYYLPDEASLAIDKQQNPQFSLIRYVIAEAQEEKQSNSIQKAGGGAILHFLINYETPEEKVINAEKRLQEITGIENVKIKGPLIFEQGKYALISSILTKDGKKKNMLMASGSAPVLEGNRIALSFDMEPETSSLLLESFKMATPDISIVFDMEFAGLSDAFDAEMTVDWEKVQRSQHIKAGGKIYFVSADVDVLFNHLRNESAIILKTSGEDAVMQALIDRVYEKLTELFFTEVDNTEVPSTVKEDVLSGISKVISGISKNLPYSAHGAYRLKDLKTTGYSKMRFDSRSTVKRHHYITFNMGDLYRKYGDDPKYFKTVAMDDPDFQQRIVHVGVDGTLMNEIGRMINNVTVTLKKQHQGGGQTVREIIVTPETMDDSVFTLEMVYGSKDDNNRLEWLNYNYRTNWKFSGGGDYITDWQSESSSMINLFCPFKRTTVQLIGDAGLLEKEGVRAAIVRLSYPFFGETRSSRIIWKPGEIIEEKSVELTLPIDKDSYTYNITLVKSDGSRTEKEGRDSSGLIFIDEF